MARRSTLPALLPALLLAATAARAQPRNAPRRTPPPPTTPVAAQPEPAATTTPEPPATPPAPTVAQPEEETVRPPTFPPDDYAPPPPEAFPPPRGPLVPLGFNAINWRPPVPVPPRPIHWDQTTAVGLSLGLGAPYGYAGAFLAYNPNRWTQVEVGAGYSAPFGPAVGFMGRGGVPLSRASVLSLGVGVSTNFTDAEYVTNCLYNVSSFPFPSTMSCNPSGAPRTARASLNPVWVNFELNDDIRFPSDFGVRFALGASVLANTASFPTARDCPGEGPGSVPCDVGLAHAEDRAFWLVYFRVDLYYLIANGAAPAPAPRPRARERTPPRSGPAGAADEGDSDG